MFNEKHKVQLIESERKKLIAIVSKGQNKAVVIQRAHILLKVDEGKTDAEISQLLYVSEQTIRRVRLRFSEEGLQAALEDKPHAPTGTEMKEEQEARLIALTCSEPPAGRARWTLELLVQQMLKDGIVTRVSAETVRLMLKKQTQALASKELVHSRSHSRIHPADGTPSGALPKTIRFQASDGLF
jgi:transposase